MRTAKSMIVFDLELVEEIDFERDRPMMGLHLTGLNERTCRMLEKTFKYTAVGTRAIKLLCLVS